MRFVVSWDWEGEGDNYGTKGTKGMKKLSLNYLESFRL